jgi:imidazoleglycerol-phosphate dehydratase/histidinol-phosphatase
MKRVLFIDRDGTILFEPPDEQIDSFEKMNFLPGVLSNLAKIAKRNEYELVMVTNQDGLGTKSFPEDTFWPVQKLMLKILESEGIYFKDIIIDRTLPSENALTRKPGTGLLKKYFSKKYDLPNSVVIGDRQSDIQLAENLGSQSICLTKEKNCTADFCTESWEEIYKYLFFPPRGAEIERITNETNIKIRVNLDGSGKSDIQSGFGFLDHMLDLFARHSSIDIIARIKGDLHVDEHHTIEDTAIVLGNAINKALKDKRGIERYGFLLPMDESYAYAAIDFSGRSNLTWKVKFRREKLGTMPTEMFYHFFKSFCDHACCSLLVKAKGKNEHHKIEAVFKAVAKAIKKAIQRDPDSQQIPSTKGLL